MPSAALNRRGFLGTVAAAGLLGTLPTPAEAARNAADADPVTTESGRVTGVQGGVRRVTVYKGVPYAASTAGANRWRPPQPAPSWNGVRAADSWGRACPQPVTGIPGDQVSRLGEDCLNLNIWKAATGSGDGPVTGTDVTGSSQGADIYHLLGYLYSTDRPWNSQGRWDSGRASARSKWRTATRGSPS